MDNVCEQLVQGRTRQCSGWDWTRYLQSPVQRSNHCATEPSLRYLRMFGVTYNMFKDRTFCFVFSLFVFHLLECGCCCVIVRCLRDSMEINLINIITKEQARTRAEQWSEPGLTSHLTDTRSLLDEFYRSHSPTNSVKAPKDKIVCLYKGQFHENWLWKR